MLLGLCACGVGSTATPTTPVDLQGAWELVEGHGPGGEVPIFDGARISLVVAATQVSGTSACNQYGGTVAIAGDQVQFSGLAVTEMACAEPIMASEAAFWEAFGGVTAAVRDGDSLTLGGPEAELRWELQPPVPVAELVDTPWRLETLVTGDAAQSVIGQPTLELGPNGALAATTGCRTLTGAYVVSGDEVHVTQLQADGSCDAGIAAQNDHVLNVIEGSFRVAIAGRQLTLTGDGGLGLVYRAAEE